MLPLYAKLAARLAERMSKSLYRRCRIKDAAEGTEIEIEGRRYINFSSNDYLGLASHPKLIEAFQHALATYGVGSGAAQLVTGHSRAHHCLEEELAAFTGWPRALVFSTGYMANLGVLGALVGRNDTVIQDRLNHASLIDAAVLSRARLKRYPHADVDALGKMLSSDCGGQRVVVTESLFGMEGDIAPLPAIAALCRRHQALLMIDDAHGFGVLGSQGQGCAAHLGLGADEVPILMATLGKAIGVFGAFVAGSTELIETLIQEARSYVYTTAPPPAMAEAIRQSLILVRTEGWRREHLYALIRHLRRGATERGISLCPSDTPIQALVLGEAPAALRASATLAERGLYVMPMRPPTVPEGTARLRISLTAQHTHAHVDRLLEALAELS